MFSFAETPETFRPRGAGPPEGMDPRLAAFLCWLLGDDVYAILRIFHVEEKADRVTVRLASMEKPPARSRFFWILSSAQPPIGEPCPPLPGIRAGGGWRIVIPRSLYVPRGEVERDVAEVGVRMMTAEEKPRREESPSERLRALRDECVVLEDFGWEGRVFTMQPVHKMLALLTPAALSMSGILAPRDPYIVYSARAKVDVKTLRRGWLRTRSYCYVEFYLPSVDGETHRLRRGARAGSHRNLKAAIRRFSMTLFGSPEPRPWGELYIVDQMIRVVSIQLWRMRGRDEDGWRARMKRKALKDAYKMLLQVRRSIIWPFFPLMRGAEYVPYSLFRAVLMWKRGDWNEFQVKEVIEQLMGNVRLNRLFRFRFVDPKTGETRDPWLDGW